MPPRLPATERFSFGNLDEVLELTERADFVNRGAMTGVVGHGGVPGVPIGPGLGIQLDQSPTRLGDVGEDGITRRAIVVSGVAGHDDCGAGGQL